MARNVAAEEGSGGARGEVGHAMLGGLSRRRDVRGRGRRRKGRRGHAVLRRDVRGREEVRRWGAPHCPPSGGEAKAPVHLGVNCPHCSAGLGGGISTRICSDVTIWGSLSRPHNCRISPHPAGLRGERAGRRDVQPQVSVPLTSVWLGDDWGRPGRPLQWSLVVWVCSRQRGALRSGSCSCPPAPTPGLY